MSRIAPPVNATSIAFLLHCLRASSISGLEAFGAKELNRTSFGFSLGHPWRMAARANNPINFAILFAWSNLSLIFSKVSSNGISWSMGKLLDLFWVRFYHREIILRKSVFVWKHAETFREKFAPLPCFGHVGDELSAQALVFFAFIWFVEDVVAGVAEASAAKAIFAAMAVVAIEEVVRVAAEVCESVAVADQAG